MSNSDLRQIARQGASDRAERLFRAAISAYCCLPRPTRAETAQLEDLAMPLYDSVSEDGLRFVAAALSECPAPPHALVLRLCMERVDIGAPLIVRSSVLTDADLISLIARRGAAHSAVVGRRKDINPVIAALVKQIEKRPIATTEQAPVAEPVVSAPVTSAPVEPAPLAPTPRADETREQLRAMMAPARATRDGVVPIHVYPRLRLAALSGDRDQVATVLGECLDLDRATASALLRTASVPHLATALRALALTGEQAVLIVAAVAPAYFARPGATRELVEKFASASIDSARQQVRQFEPQDNSATSFARHLARAALARSA